MVGEIIISGILPMFWEQDTRIQKLGFTKKRMWDTWICGTALRGKKTCTREGWLASEWQGGSSFCRGTVGDGRQRIG